MRILLIVALLSACTPAATAKLGSAQSAASSITGLGSQLTQMWRMVNPPPTTRYPSYPLNYPGRPY